MGAYTGMSKEDLTLEVELLRSFLRGNTSDSEIKSSWAEDRRIEFFQIDRNELRRNLAEAEQELARVQDGVNKKVNSRTAGRAIGVDFRRS